MEHDLFPSLSDYSTESCEELTPDENNFAVLAEGEMFATSDPHPPRPKSLNSLHESRLLSKRRWRYFVFLGVLLCLCRLFGTANGESLSRSTANATLTVNSSVVPPGEKKSPPSEAEMLETKDDGSISTTQAPVLANGPQNASKGGETALDNEQNPSGQSLKDKRKNDKESKTEGPSKVSDPPAETTTQPSSSPPPQPSTPTEKSSTPSTADLTSNPTTTPLATSTTTASTTPALVPKASETVEATLESPGSKKDSEKDSKMENESFDSDNETGDDSGSDLKGNLHIDKTGSESGVRFNQGLTRRVDDDENHALGYFVVILVGSVLAVALWRKRQRILAYMIEGRRGGGARRRRGNSGGGNGHGAHYRKLKNEDDV